jgi:hypothetical protein
VRVFTATGEALLTPTAYPLGELLRKIYTLHRGKSRDPIPLSAVADTVEYGFRIFLYLYISSIGGL